MFPKSLTPEFNFDAMRKLASAAGAAYCKPHEAEGIAAASGATTFVPLECQATDTQGFIAATESDVVISFCGTTDIRDWLTNCKFLRKPHRDFPGAIHDGFGDAYDSVKQEVRHALWSLSEQPNVGLARKIWVTGHSLGGALAVLCAADLRSTSMQIAGVYTFGQPRVGEKEFAAAYDSVLREITFRLVNRNDIVPRVPGALIGYRHCGREIFLDAFGGAIVDPSWLRKLPSDIWGIACELSQGRQLRALELLATDHFMAAYLSRINK